MPRRPGSAVPPDRRPGCWLYLQSDHRRPQTIGYYCFSKERYENGGKYNGCGTKNQRQSTLNEITVRFLTEQLSKPSTIKAILQHAAVTKVATLDEPLPDSRSISNPGSVDWDERGRRLDKLFEMDA
jgi:hypothetical protein